MRGFQQENPGMFIIMIQYNIVYTTWLTRGLL
jgi:hypothetical protein